MHSYDQVSFIVQSSSYICNVLGDGVDGAVSWLKTYDKPEHKVLNLWELTSKRRLGYIHGQDSPPLGQILDMWPRLRDLNGYLLVGVKLQCRVYSGFVICCACLAVNLHNLLL
jgi:hypothetical protein